MSNQLETPESQPSWVVSQITAHTAEISALLEGHKQLAEGQKQLSKTLEESTNRILDVIEKTHGQFNDRIRDQQEAVQTLRDRQDADRMTAGKPNFQAIGIAFAIVTTVLGYYVQSQVGDTRAILSGTKSDLIELDKKVQTLNDTAIRNDERMNLLLQGKIKVGP
jgi:flagellar motility protein MotE (MotC chaperone)